MGISPPKTPPDPGVRLSPPGRMGVGGDSERQPDSTLESVTPWAWRFRCSRRDSGPLPASFFLRKTEVVARGTPGVLPPLDGGWGGGGGRDRRDGGVRRAP